MSEASDGAISYRLRRLESEHAALEREMHEELKEVHRKLDRLMVAIVGGLLTLSVSLIVVAASILVGNGNA